MTSLCLNSGSKLFMFADIVLTDKWRPMWKTVTSRGLTETPSRRLPPGRSILSCHCFHLTPLVTQNFLCAFFSHAQLCPQCFFFFADSLWACHPTRLSGFGSFCIFFLTMNAFMLQTANFLPHPHEAGWTGVFKCPRRDVNKYVLLLLTMLPVLGGATPLWIYCVFNITCSGSDHLD